jgi:hypothetical protein
MNFLLITLSLLATPIAEPGQRYEAGKRLQLPSANLSIVLPKGWFGGLIPGETLLALASHTHAGMLIVSVDGRGLKALAQELAQPIPVEEGVFLQPDGRQVLAKGRLRASFKLPGNPAVHGIAEARQFGSEALGVLALGPRAQARKQRAWMARILDSVRREKSRLPQFSGKHLKWFHTANGMADRRVIRLCRNGRYHESGSNSYLSTGVDSTFSASGSSGGQGKWQAAGNSLTLISDRGEQEVFRVQRKQGKLLLNGERWFLVDGDC